MKNPCKEINIPGNDSLPRNRVLKIIANKEIGVMLSPVTPTIDLKDVVKGARFQFSGDRHWQHEVLDGEFVHIKTIFAPTGGTDHKYYIIHYSWLKKSNI